MDEEFKNEASSAVKTFTYSGRGNSSIPTFRELEEDRQREAHERFIRDLIVSLVGCWNCEVPKTVRIAERLAREYQEGADKRAKERK